MTAFTKYTTTDTCKWQNIDITASNYMPPGVTPEQMDTIVAEGPARRAAEDKEARTNTTQNMIVAGIAIAVAIAGGIELLPVIGVCWWVSNVTKG